MIDQCGRPILSTFVPREWRRAGRFSIAQRRGADGPFLTGLAKRQRLQVGEFKLPFFFISRPVSFPHRLPRQASDRHKRNRMQSACSLTCSASATTVSDVVRARHHNHNHYLPDAISITRTCPSAGHANLSLLCTICSYHIIANSFLSIP